MDVGVGSSEVVNQNTAICMITLVDIVSTSSYSHCEDVLDLEEVADHKIQS